MQIHDIAVIARFELARQLRSRHTWVAAALLVPCCAFASHQLAEYADQLTALGREIGPGIDMIAGMVEGLTGLPMLGVRRILTDHPPVLVALFALMLALLPFFGVLLAYDQTATETETKHVRYLLFRCDRRAIFLGKALAAELMIVGAVGLALVIVAAFLGLRSNALGGVAGILYLLRMWLSAALLALPLVALLGLLSALVSRARQALGLALLLWVGIGIASGLLGLADERLGALDYAWPSTGRFRLLFDEGGSLATELGYLLVYTLLVGALGLAWYRRRDL